MSVFLTVVLTQQLLAPGSFTVGHAAILFTEEMCGGALLGAGGGYLLLLILRRLKVETAIYPVLALMGALLLFAAAQSVGASGFIAVYLAGVIVGNSEHKSISVPHAWLACHPSHDPLDPVARAGLHYCGAAFGCTPARLC
jgi:cell volume regulation protein A